MRALRAKRPSSRLYNRLRDFLRYLLCDVPHFVLRASLLCTVAWGVGGCAVGPLPTAPNQDDVTLQAAPDSSACAAAYAALDTQIDQTGVRDAGATRITAFPYARVDRFTAALRDKLQRGDADATSADLPPTPAWPALMQRLQQLDGQARAIEWANLPQASRAVLMGAAPVGEPGTWLQRLQDCGARWAASDLGNPVRLADLRQRLVVPDDYVTAYRVAGLYALSSVPFGMGIRRFEAERRVVFSGGAVAVRGAGRIRWSPPEVSTTNRAQTPDILPQDALGVPAPSQEQLDQLFTQFAPVFDIAVASDDDRPGALAWRQGAAGDAAPQVSVNREAPVVYRYASHTRYGATSLLQLVYTVWFGARTQSEGLDLLAGHIDGLVVRVTLGPDGTPLVYDSIHPCGCYHMFFPTPLARPKPAPDDQLEWAFLPQTLPSYDPQKRLVLHVAAGTHYIDRISVEPMATPVGGLAGPPTARASYTLRDYDELRSLPLSGAARRSVFGVDGFMPGTDRAERWLFWPMGIARAGSMRQAGRQATAFVGRRHFDDADLMAQRFDFDLRQFDPR